MEKELNIAAILKDKPQGTKLYDWLYNIDIELDTISTTDTEIVVWCTNETDNNTICHRAYSEFGTVRNCPNGLQILLPSRGMRDWSKFAWKKGDILVSNDNDSHIIFAGFSKDDYTTFEGKHWISVSKKRYISCLNVQKTQDYHIEDDKDAVQTYINTIEKRFGGKLNLETMKIEHTEPKQEFKDGDIAYADYGHKQAVFIVSGKTDLSEGYNSFITLDLRGLTLDMGCIMSFFKKDLCKLRLATEEEKQQLFSALEKEGKRWNPDTKSIEDLPKKCEFKPFQKVLAKFDEDCEWMPDFFYHYDKSDSEMPYVCIANGRAIECIPYNEETKHLLGTTDEWKGGK